MRLQVSKGGYERGSPPAEESQIPSMILSRRLSTAPSRGHGNKPPGPGWLRLSQRPKTYNRRGRTCAASGQPLPPRKGSCA